VRSPGHSRYLYFISGVFIPNVNLPGWLRHVGEVFPVQHLADGLHHAYDPAATGAGTVWTDIGVLALWAGIGLVVALRRFSWTRRKERVAQPLRPSAPGLQQRRSR
jgi:ABC-type multidrug transport system permease subunit